MVFVSCLGHGSATAQGAALTQWGLLGTWAVDCAKPSSESTRLMYHARANGSAFHTRDFGKGALEPNEILRASILGDGSIFLLIDLADLRQNRHTRELIFVRQADGRVRVVSNRRPDGDYTVRDGKLLANGNDTPWQRHCR